MIAKLISGGQSGVDLAGLDAAKAMGIPTGGWMPRGWLTEDGPRPEYAERYGLQEMPTADYPSRTRQNVSQADGTLILTQQRLSGGTLLTFNVCKAAGKTRFVVCFPGESHDDAWVIAVVQVAAWIKGHGVQTLNAAGPRESKCPGIYQRARAFLLAVLRPEGGGS
jgi:hypothetical protein